MKVSPRTNRFQMPINAAWWRPEHSSFAHELSFIHDRMLKLWALGIRLYHKAQEEQLWTDKWQQSEHYDIRACSSIRDPAHSGRRVSFEGLIDSSHGIWGLSVGNESCILLIVHKCILAIEWFFELIPLLSSDKRRRSISHMAVRNSCQQPLSRSYIHIGVPGCEMWESAGHIEDDKWVVFKSYEY